MSILEPTAITGVVSFVPQRFEDERGYFCETYNEKFFAELTGSAVKFVQDNESKSVKTGTVRGLHFQTLPYAQCKLVRVISGKLIDVCVDIRRSSPTFGQHISIELDAINGRQLWIPEGIAHGFCTLEPDTTISYKVTDFFDASSDRSLLWNDHKLSIKWPELADPLTLSEKDLKALTIDELDAKGDLFD